MDLTHNHMNQSIDKIEHLFRKGIPGAKKNKIRQIRAEIRKMREKQSQCIIFKDIYYYFKQFIKSKFNKRK